LILIKPSDKAVLLRASWRAHHPLYLDKPETIFNASNSGTWPTTEPAHRQLDEPRPSATVLVALSPKLIDLLAASPQGAAAFTGDGHADSKIGLPGADAAALASRTMDLPLDVDLSVSISFGKTQLRKPTTGSIVGLNRGVDEGSRSCLTIL
jgi:hypothetical protein